MASALMLLDLVRMGEISQPAYTSVLLVAEVVAVLESLNSANGYDIIENGMLSDAYIARVIALFSTIEQAQLIDANTAIIQTFKRGNIINDHRPV